ncbi:MAG: hypothetical protein FJ224_04600 [Lentisphaerae bacterium]|nr:hypothetical protein [Lentisphaerota bacterium]
MRLPFHRHIAIALSALLSAAVESLAQDQSLSRSYLAAGMEILSEAERCTDRTMSRELLYRAAETLGKAAETSSGPEAEEALFRSAEVLLKINDYESRSLAFTALCLHGKRFPSGRLAPDAGMLKGEFYANERIWGRAVKTWTDTAAAYPAAPVAPLAHYRCAKVFEENIRNAGEAIRCYTTVIEKYPKSDVADDSLMARAGIRNRERMFNEAAADYLAVAEQYTTSDTADRAMAKAIELTESDLRNYAEAHRLCVEFRRRFPHSSLLTQIERIEARTLKYARTP